MKERSTLSGRECAPHPAWLSGSGAGQGIVWEYFHYRQNRPVKTARDCRLRLHE